MQLRVCRVDEVVDDELTAFAVEGLEWPVMATRVEGELVVATSICPHEVVSLVDGELVGDIVVCPGHGYRFDLRTGACSHDPGLRLRRFAVAERGGEVWIDLLREP